MAVADPTNVQAIDELRLATRFTLEIGVAPVEEIDLELKRLERASEAWERAALVEEEFDLGGEEEARLDHLEADDGVSDAPLVRRAVLDHPPGGRGRGQRYRLRPGRRPRRRSRVDGVLHQLQRIPKRLLPWVMRLKVLAKLDIAERRKPQDGRISLLPGR